MKLCINVVEQFERTEGDLAGRSPLDLPLKLNRLCQLLNKAIREIRRQTALGINCDLGQAGWQTSVRGTGDKKQRKSRLAAAIVRADDAIDGNRSADPEEIARTRWQHLASRDQGKIVDGCEVLIDFCAWPIDHPVGPVDPTLIEGPVETRSRMTLPGRIVGHPSSRCGEFPTARVACGVTG